jgi:hypothetical protein
MCPDHQLLSVYQDGELPSPWKEKMEVHLSQCPKCSGQLERYRALLSPLREPGQDAPGAGESKERVWNALEARLRKENRFTSPWRRRISIPLPAAAAAAVLILTALAVLWLRKPAENTALPGMIVASEENLSPGLVPVSDMNGVLQYLGQGASGDILVLRLPESRNFTSFGEPAIIKAADYARNTPVRGRRQ